jgi:hypothetical protein
MANADSNSAQKPLVYDLLNRLNAAFVRVHRNMAALQEIGIFDPLMMQTLNRQSEQLRAGTNYHLLGAMRRIEERDRERYSQGSISQPTISQQPISPQTISQQSRE